MKHQPLDRQVIVVTGASSGIGLCTALLAAGQGARVALLARSIDVLDDVVATIRAEGGQAIACAVDVARREDVDAAVARIMERFGRIDTWVNNAGVSIYGRLDQVTDEDSRRLFDVNFWGVVHGSLAALPYLRQQSGVLVNLGSEVSDTVLPLQGMYSASKHAVKGFTDALRIEEESAAGTGVSVVLVQPTAVDTPYPQNACNYLAGEPKLPAPLIAPERVASAILHAAGHGGRDVTVGAMAAVNTRLSRWMPRLADRMAALQLDRQEAGAPIRDRLGALHRPGNAGRIHGSGPR